MYIIIIAFKADIDHILLYYVGGKGLSFHKCNC